MELVSGCGAAPQARGLSADFPSFLQMLLGAYRCADAPGEFAWQPGALVQAVAEGRWVLLENIDYAPLDVVRHLHSNALTSCLQIVLIVILGHYLYSTGYFIRDGVLIIHLIYLSSWITRLISCLIENQ